MWTKCVVGYVAAMNLLVTIYYWVFSGYLFTKNFGYWLSVFKLPLVRSTADGMADRGWKSGMYGMRYQDPS